MKITVCIGSSCHIKGSRQVVETFQKLVTEHHLEDKIEICGTFCLGKCQDGVCLSLDKEIFSVTPETAKDFFEKTVLSRV